MGLLHLIFSAYRQTVGQKKRIFSYLLLAAFFIFFIDALSFSPHPVWTLLAQTFLAAPFYAGILLLAVRVSRGELFSLRHFLGCLKNWLQLGITQVVVVFFFSGLIAELIKLSAPLLSEKRQLVVMDVTLFLVLFFIQTSFLFALPLMVDRKLWPWRALFQSFKACWAKRNILEYGFLILATGVLVTLSGGLTLLLGHLLRVSWLGSAVLMLGGMVFFYFYVPTLLMLWGNFYNRNIPISVKN